MSIPSISIQNKNGVAMLIDEEDLGLLTQHKDGHWSFVVPPKGYAHLRDKKEHGGLGQVVYFHRLVMNLPTGLQVHHINGNKLDNRKKNLQLCVCSQNIINIAVSEVSRFRGVSKNGKKWRARIRSDSVLKNLGTFATELEAARAYDSAAKLQGFDFHFLNFPNEATNA